MKLVIGSKKYSTWSMRPWVFMTHHGVSFDEQVIPFHIVPGTRRHTEETDRRMAAASPNGRVPVLELPDGTRINESLAICEFISETLLSGRGWPAGPVERARARAISLEMASGFTELRRLLPMCIGETASGQPEVPAPAQKDVARILAIIGELREEYLARGPYLFGGFSIADAMYAPVIQRFETYRVPLPGAVAAYAERIAAVDAVRKWCDGARSDPLEIAAIGDIVKAYPREIGAACKI